MSSQKIKAVNNPAATLIGDEGTRVLEKRLSSHFPAHINRAEYWFLRASNEASHQ